MTVASVLIPDDRPDVMRLAAGRHIPKRRVFLGRVRPKTLPQVPRFGRFLAAFGATPPPTNVDYYTKAAPALSRMYRNDARGCCVISGKFHQLGTWSANDSDAPALITVPDSDIDAMYNLLKAGPGDSGCVITDVLNHFKSPGLVGNSQYYKIDGYVAPDWTNKLEVQVALYLFGSLTIGINLPDAWTQGGNFSTWDVTNSSIVGGHDVCCVGYNATGVVIATWGGLRTITWTAFLQNRWVEECYAQLAPSWYNSDKLAPCGVMVDKLVTALAQLGGGSIPPIPDPTPPDPPTPIPPATKKAVVIPDQSHWYGTVKGGTYPVVDVPAQFIQDSEANCIQAETSNAGPRGSLLDYFWILRDVVPIVRDAVTQNWAGLGIDIVQFVNDWRSHFASAQEAHDSLGFSFRQFVLDAEKLVTDYQAGASAQTLIADIKALAGDLNIPWPFGDVLPKCPVDLCDSGPSAMTGNLEPANFTAAASGSRPPASFTLTVIGNAEQLRGIATALSAVQ